MTWKMQVEDDGEYKESLCIKKHDKYIFYIFSKTTQKHS